MKSHEIREKTLEDIKNDLLAAQENLRTLNFQLVTHQLEKTSQISAVKRDIARLKTIVREREISAGSQASAAVSEE